MARPPKPPPKPKIPVLTEARLRAAARAAVNAAAVGIVEFANQEAASFQKAIAQQRFSSFKRHPLADSTLAKKAMYNRSYKVMISTGSYVAGIRVTTRPAKDGGLHVFIGHHPRLMARDTRTGKPRPGVPMRKVAFWNEHGAPNAGIPARPHWRSAAAAMKKRSPAAKRRILLLARAAWRRSLGMPSRP